MKIFIRQIISGSKEEKRENLTSNNVTMSTILNNRHKFYTLTSFLA